MKFIDEISDFIHRNYGEKLENYCIVLPNRRSGLFLKKKLVTDAAKAMFLPRILSIEEYIYEMSGMKLADETALLAMLYRSYTKVLGTKAYEFDHFYSTGKLIINDFSDLDEYLADPKEVFEYLFRVKEIEGWFPDQSDTAMQLSYLEFYKALKSIYFDFHDQLLKNKLAYRGLASRVLAELKTEGTAFSFEKICFAGLNAISPSFENHIDYLLKEKKSDLLWDVDTMYLDDEFQEAGSFLRKAKSKWPFSFKENEKSYFATEKDIHFIGAPYQFAQVQLGVNILLKQIKEGKNTLLVLADEEMLPAFLSSIPDELTDNINVSMGLSLKDTLTGQLIKDLITLHLNPLLSSTQGATHFHYYDLRRFLSNPLFTYLIDESQRERLLKIKKMLFDNPRKIMHPDYTPIKKEKSASANQWLGQLAEISGALFKPWKNWKEMNSLFINICQKVFRDTYEKDELYQEREASWRIISSIESLKNIFSQDADDFFEINAIADFILRYIRSSRIPLKGEPLKGVQILGLLETRAMDFDHVIILGVNEDVLPSSSRSDSFIPLDVRRDLKLPLPSDTEAVFAYHFYRLMQRSKSFTLVYNTENDPLWGKEPSRYLSQLEHEISKKYPLLKLKRSVLDITYNNIILENFVLPSKEYLHQRLDEINDKALSFTSLYDFMSCPYKFALARILKIPQPDDDLFQLESRELGDVFHNAIEKLLKNYIGRELNKETANSILKEASAAFDFALDKNKIKDRDYGNTFLVLEVLHDSYMRFLKGYCKRAETQKIIIKESELMLNYSISLDDARQINLQGTVDLLEQVDTQYCVMDFKTTKKNPNLKHQEEIEIGKQKNLIQLLFYSLLFMRKRPDVNNVLAGNYLILLKNNSLPLFVTDKKKLILDNAIIDNFEGFLKEYIEMLFSDKQEFNPQPSKEGCMFCPYKNTLCFNYYE